MSRFLLFFIFSLSVLVGSINGRTGCESTPTSSEMESYEESQRRMGRIGLECENEGGSGSSYATIIILDLFISAFVIFWIVLAIWCVCVQRQKAINAAHLNNFPGQVVGAQVAHGTDLRSYPETTTVQKGDLDYRV